MAYAFASASSQYLTATAPLTDEPFTMAIITRGQSNNLAMFLSLNNLTAFNNKRIEYNSTSGNFGAVVTNGSVSSASTIAMTPGDVNFCVGQFTSTTSLTSYLNATAGNTDATNSSAITGITTLGIGARWNTAWGLFANGDLAEAAIWSVALTAAEITSLSKGFKASRIRPQSLVFYAPLIRNLQDTKGALALTNNNTATVAVHPRVY